MRHILLNILPEKSLEIVKMILTEDKTKKLELESLRLTDMI